MSKIKFKVKLTGLEIEFEGTKDELRQVSSGLGQQLTGLIQPNLGDTPDDNNKNNTSQTTVDGSAEIIASQIKGKKIGRKNKNNSSGIKAEKTTAKVVQFKNDPNAYGAPTQKWIALEKALWTLYVVEAQASISELSAGDISETFNAHFRQLGPIRASNVSRDLGKKKAGADALVGENVAAVPNTWYLMEAGKKFVQNLIANQKTNGVN